ncbi:hypothetical protein [Marinobacterium sp. BA1]|uniref:hypothetical protein n=1 Tax=Marinobacterium sp. BA1 TaxID=3138931 RepID=UPI0032E78B27
MKAIKVAPSTSLTAQISTPTARLVFNLVAKQIPARFNLSVHISDIGNGMRWMRLQGEADAIRSAERELLTLGILCAADGCELDIPSLPVADSWLERIDHTVRSFGNVESQSCDDSLHYRVANQDDYR